MSCLEPTDSAVTGAGPLEARIAKHERARRLSNLVTAMVKLFCKGQRRNEAGIKNGKANETRPDVL
jgi:hypothetical protein